MITSIPGYCEFTYNTDSLLADMVFNNGVTTSFTYDDCHRPVTIDTLKGDVPLLSMDYHYDPVGNITHLEYSRDQWIQSEETFQYDWLDRLVYTQGDYGILQYSYDSVGNRLSQNGITSTYNNMNELVSVSDGTVFTYDDNGNTTTKTGGDTTWVYTYDARNLLTQVTKNHKICAQYTYDGNGKRIQKTEWIESLQDYQTITYVYSGPNVIYERNTDTNQEALYVYGPTGSPKQYIEVYNRQGEFLWKYQDIQPFMSIAMSDDGRYITAGSKNILVFFDNFAAIEEYKSSECVQSHKDEQFKVCIC